MRTTPDGLPIAPARYTLIDVGRAALATPDARTDGLAARPAAVADALYDATARVRVAQRRADPGRKSNHAPPAFDWPAFRARPADAPPSRPLARTVA